MARTSGGGLTGWFPTDALVFSPRVKRAVWGGRRGVAMHVKVLVSLCMFMSVRLSACRVPLGLLHAICSL